MVRVTNAARRARQETTQGARYEQARPIHPVLQMHTPSTLQTPCPEQIFGCSGPPGQRMLQL
eukprot:753985-Hanusia_phi.AAC.7